MGNVTAMHWHQTCSVLLAAPTSTLTTMRPRAGKSFQLQKRNKIQVAWCRESADKHATPSLPCCRKVARPIQGDASVATTSRGLVLRHAKPYRGQVATRVGVLVVIFAQGKSLKLMVICGRARRDTKLHCTWQATMCVCSVRRTVHIRDPSEPVLEQAFTFRPAIASEQTASRCKARACHFSSSSFHGRLLFFCNDLSRSPL